MLAACLSLISNLLLLALSRVVPLGIWLSMALTAKNLHVAIISVLPGLEFSSPIRQSGAVFELFKYILLL